MTSAGKFALAGFAAGTVMAGAPFACGIIFSLTRRPIDKNSFLHVEDGSLVTSDGKNVLLSGIDMNESSFTCFKDGIRSFDSEKEIFNQLEKRFGNYGAREIYGKGTESALTPADIKLMKKAGISCLRIPLRQHLLFKNSDTKKQEPSLDRLDGIIKACRKAGIYVILSLAADENDKELFDCGKKGFDKRNELIKLWLKIAGHYKKEAAVAGYDLLDGLECTESKKSDTLLKFYLRAAKALRGTDDEHIVFIRGTYGDKELKNIKDKNTAFCISGEENPAKEHKAEKFPLILLGSGDTQTDGLLEKGISCISGSFKGKDENSLYRIALPQIDIENDSYETINEKLSTAFSTENAKKNAGLASKLTASGLKTRKEEKNKNNRNKIYYSYGSVYKAGK